MELANIAHRATSLRSSTISVMQYVNSQFDSSLTWKDVDWLRQLWDGPFVLKGVLSVGEAQKAVSVGASAIMVSNHGGRQLDGVSASIDRVGEIANAVGDKVEIIVDGGIRRGTHILKALALGARACSIGRPYLYGLAAGGERGVQLVLSHLRTELERDMILLGAPSLSLLSSRYIRRRETRA
jgi:L-lactate dehydrogenase (cytochrome)